MANYGTPAKPGRPLRLVTVLGARPQFVKAFPLSRLIRVDGRFEEIVVHTGQHFDYNMSEIFFSELGIDAPRHFLNIHGGSHGAMTGQMIESVEGVLMMEQPAAVIVYGDTNSTLAGALAAAKLDIPVVHIEAGLRSYNRKTPEEVNRVVVDHLSTLLFCPNDRAVKNLEREGIVEGVHEVGDLMVDAALLAAPIASRMSDILDRMKLEPGSYGVATFHRAENVDDAEQLARIVEFLNAEAARRFLVLPLHPRTRNALNNAGLRLDCARTEIIDPLGYLDMCQLLRSAQIVFTDSGGLQREAYLHRVPCVTLRSETEWYETVEHGWNRIWTVPNYLARSEIPGYGVEVAAGRILDTVDLAFAAKRQLSDDRPQGTDGP